MPPCSPLSCSPAGSWEARDGWPTAPFASTASRARQARHEGTSASATAPQAAVTLGARVQRAYTLAAYAGELLQLVAVPNVHASRLFQRTAIRHT
jgi:hypothetical protein